MIRDITIGQYYNKESLIHSLDPRVKLVWTFVFLISLFISSSVYAYMLAILFLAIIIILSKVPFRFITRGLKSLLFLLLLSVVFNIFLTPGEIVYSIGSIHITKEGLILSARLAIRLVILVIGSSLLTLTTTPNKLTEGLEKGLSFMKVLKVPVTDIALMMSISLRFIPILVSEVDKIEKAQMSRGADFENGGVIKKAKAMVPLLVPLFVSAFRRASDLAYAMEARCYNDSDKRTKMYPLRYKTIDKISYICIFLYILLIVLMRFL
ncbi:MAG: energy-coupling factor transporter transmembrane protein EcfT [Lachnospiraceae bacterium]|nr:energy-coupling factor transporter transmembrane protein EcfT [Lachnospiraceae bacterium]